MEVILQQDYPALGYVGDVVKVRSGYARNFLIPRGVALELSSRNAKLLTHKMAGVQAKRTKLKAQAEEVATRLKEVKLEFTLIFGQAGKAFGAVSARDIELDLNSKGFTFERRQIRLAQAIKSAGTFKIEVKLHSEVVVPLEVKVQVQKAVSPEGEAEPRGRGRRGKRVEASEAPAEESAEGTASPETDNE